MKRTRIVFQGILWILIYLLLTLSPLLILLISPRPSGREFWREFSVVSCGELSCMSKSRH
jgi:hypothetical protein